MTFNLDSKYKKFIFAAALLGFTPVNAFAGFEWTPPDSLKSNVESANENIVMPKGSALPIPPAVVEEQILAIPPSKNTPTLQESPKPSKSPKPVLKTQRVGNNKPETKAEPIKKTITRQNRKPTPIPAAQQPIPLPNMEPVAAEKSKQIDVIERQPEPAAPVSSVPRRKKPSMNHRAKVDLEETGSKKIAREPEQRTGARVREKIDTPVQKQTIAQVSEPIPDVEQAPVQEKSRGLKINPYPKKMKAPALTPMSETMTEGDKALESVYSGKSDGAGSFTVAEGFGMDIPLALALSQIVPPSYAYSFGDGVNPGRKVSWSGGKPWNIILNETLAPLNLGYSIQGNRILLETLDKPVISIQQSELKKKLN